MKEDKHILLDLLGHDTQNSNRQGFASTNQALNSVAEILSYAGVKVEFQDYTVDSGNGQQVARKNLVAKLEENAELPTVGLQGHIDTVPFGDYGGNPLGEKEGGRIYGRGAVDMKASLASMIYVMMRAPGMANLAVNPRLIITSDEEAHSFAGIKRFLEDNPPIDFAICGEPTGMQVVDRGKGAISAVIDVFGKSGHGSRPYQGENAIVKALPLLNDLAALSSGIRYVTNPDFESSDSYSHRSSMNIGRIQAGETVNVIPAQLRIELEMRCVQPSDKYLALLEETMAPHRDLVGAYNVVFAHDPMRVQLDKDSPLCGKVLMLSNESGVFNGFSEAVLLNDTGIPTIVYGVGDSRMCHSSQEYVDIADLKAYTQKLTDFIS